MHISAVVHCVAEAMTIVIAWTRGQRCTTISPNYITRLNQAFLAYILKNLGRPGHKSKLVFCHSVQQVHCYFLVLSDDIMHFPSTTKSSSSITINVATAKQFLQVELFQAETEKKEAIPKLNICDFLRSEVKYICHSDMLMCK